MFVDEEDKGFPKPQLVAHSLQGKPPLEIAASETTPQFVKPKNKSPRDIDSQFDLEEDPDKPMEKYGEDFNISDDDDNNDDDGDENDQVKEVYSKVVPQSLPMNINFGVDPYTKQPRGPIHKETEKEVLPTGSIYENMQLLSRSIQSDDYRNRVWGTRPEQAESLPYSQSFQSHHGPSRPRAYFCSQPAQRINISEETLEESSSLETPK